MTERTPHIAVLYNPVAGKGRGAERADTAVTTLRAAGSSVRVYAGDSLESTRALAVQALAAAPRVLVVVGGDGTLTAILDALAGATVPVALVPSGTGNDFARAVGIPRGDAAAAARLALTGTPRQIDVGEVTSGGVTTPFVTIAALGFDAKVSDRTNRLRWPRGAARYYLALVIELARLRPTRFRLSVDGDELGELPGTLVAVGNTESYGGGMPICQGAEPDDGLLDFVHVAPLRRIRLLRLFPQLLKGTHLGLPQVIHRRARTIQVSAPDLVVYADGERLGERECTIGIRARALTVLVPTEGHHD